MAKIVHLDDYELEKVLGAIEAAAALVDALDRAGFGASAGNIYVPLQAELGNASAILRKVK